MPEKLSELFIHLKRLKKEYIPDKKNYQYIKKSGKSKMNYMSSFLISSSSNE